MKRKALAPPLSVKLLALPETTPTTLHAFLEVFSAVGVAWGEMTGEPAPARRIDTQVVARHSAPFASPAGPLISPHSRLADCGPADVVIVTDLALSPSPPWTFDWQAEAEWLQRQAAQGAVLGSVCTGSVLLAEAGLLDGLDATTHWGGIGIFQDCYPKVRLRPERVLCPAGQEQDIITSGGHGSWEDLALYLIARFCGEAEAVRIAKIFLLGDRSDGQLVFSTMGRPRHHEDPEIGDCQSWIAVNYAVANPVTRMIERSRLSPRTFKRRFKMATGYAPLDYVQALRIEEAKQLLETTEDATDAIAHAVGYEDPAFFRRLFKRRTGVTPARYRQRFRPIASGKLPPGNGRSRKAPAST